MGCIYLITCIPTGKYYVGKTVKTARRRWHEHTADVRRGARGCTYLHAAIKKYGPASFTVETLSESRDKQSLVSLERLWIILLDSQNRIVGMNLTSGGDGTPGVKRPPMPDSVRKAFDRTGKSPWNKGQKASPEQVAKQKENYWQKRKNAIAIKEMLKSQAKNKLGKKFPK